jgi:hypothetical protein
MIIHDELERKEMVVACFKVCYNYIIPKEPRYEVMASAP